MSFSSQSLLTFFPVGVTPRPAQLEILDFIERSVLSGELNIIIQAPTGVGKSYIAKAVCDWLRSGYICTSTKQLQDQYLADFSDLVTVKGRSNFTCSLNKNILCDEGKCTLGSKVFKCSFGLTVDQPCTKSNLNNYLSNSVQNSANFAAESASRGTLLWRSKHHCPYYNNKVLGLNAPVSIQNYAYLLTEHRSPGDFAQRKVIVFDECQNIEKELMNFLELSISNDSVDLYNKYAQDNSSFTLFKKSAQFSSDENYNASLDYYLNFLNSFDEKLSILLLPSKCATIKTEDLKKFNKLQTKLTTVLSLFAKDRLNWVVEELQDGINNLTSLKFKPIYVKDYTESVLFCMGAIKIFMSATILDANYFAKTLGLTSYVYKEIDPVFTPAQNKVFSLRFADFSYMKLNRLTAVEKKDFFMQVVRKIDAILDYHKNEKGIVHCGTYEIQDYIRSFSKHFDRFIFPTAADKTYLLNAHKIALNTVVCSPSITEGVDFKDDLSRFQIIVKLPYLDLSDLQISRRLKVDPFFYTYSAAKTLIQESGRSVRNVSDWCSTYVLDTRFDDFCYKNSVLTKVLTRHCCKKTALPASIKSMYIRKLSIINNRSKNVVKKSINAKKCTAAPVKLVC